MSGVRYTLLGDGASDRVLMHVIDWGLRELGVVIEQASWADLGVVSPRPFGLAERMQAAVRFYPCDILFVHRDAERDPHDVRCSEIRKAAEGLALPCIVAVVPVRMTEAWLLHDEQAIRRASGNPSGTIALGLPAIRSLEALPDPKKFLFDVLLLAADLRGHRRERRRRDLPQMRLRVAELIDDFSPLRAAKAFAAFVEETRQAIERRATPDA